MAQLTKRITILLATIVLGTTLHASGANAAVFAPEAISIASGPDLVQTVTVDGGRPDRDGDHHRRFCVKLNALLSRLVDNDVVTREQKLRIMDAFNCVRDEPATTDPTATRPAAAR